MDQRTWWYIWALIFTVLSGVGDAQGFLHSARLWNNGHLMGAEVGKATLGYIVGIGAYWVAIRYFNQLGINSPTIQTIAWFVVAIVGVAVLTGEVLKWGWLDMTLSAVAVMCIGWLMIRNGG